MVKLFVYRSLRSFFPPESLNEAINRKIITLIAVKIRKADETHGWRLANVSRIILLRNQTQTQKLNGFLIREPY